MIYLSKFPFKTLKTLPKVSDNRSTSLLLQGGYIRQSMAWAYEFLPMGHRVYTNIERVVREEMDRAGYHEMLMTVLTPRDLWEVTDRWEIPEYFKVPWHGNSEYRISPTAEENVTSIFKEFIQSYKDLPTCVYQIQKKFRNEKRAKSGLLRGREFTMKDAYSFHKNIEEFESFYEDAKNVYMNVYNRLGIGNDTVIADADWGAISDKNSHEFQTFLEIWEDIIVSDSSGYCYNLELASWVADNKNISEDELPMEVFDTVSDIVSIESMAEYFNAPTWQMLKTVVYKTESWKHFAIIVRWDLDINEIKVRKFVAKKYWEDFTQATEEDLEKLWTVRGFVTPLRGSDLELDAYWDESLYSAKNYFAWANKLAKSTKNVNISDLDILDFGDFNEPVEGFTSKNIEGEKLSFRRACEVWNIFHLWTKYSAPFKLSYLDENNKTVDKVEMWCYWIWVSRLMWVMAEYFMTDSWIEWPEEIAPYSHYIIAMWDEGLERAKEFASKIENEGWSVIIDDRAKVWFGQKASDCELFWVPNRIVFSPKTLEKGWYELKKRWMDPEIISL